MNNLDKLVNLQYYVESNRSDLIEQLNALFFENNIILDESVEYTDETLIPFREFIISGRIDDSEIRNMFDVTDTEKTETIIPTDINESKQTVMDVAKEIYGSIEDAKKAFKEDYSSFYAEMSAQLDDEEDVKLIDGLFNISESGDKKYSGDYVVVWSDRDYESGSKNFKNDPNGAPENAKIKAQKYADSLNKKDSESSFGLYRDVKVVPYEDMNESFEVKTSFYDNLKKYNSKIGSQDAKLILDASGDLAGQFNSAVLAYSLNNDKFSDDFIAFIDAIFEESATKFLFSDPQYKDVFENIFGSKNNYKDSILSLCHLMTRRLDDGSLQYANFGEEIVRSLLPTEIKPTELLENRMFGKNIMPCNESIVNHLLKNNKNLFKNSLNESIAIVNSITRDTLGIVSKDFKHCAGSVFNGYKLNESKSYVALKHKISSLNEDFDSTLSDVIDTNGSDVSFEITPQFIEWLCGNSYSSQDLNDFLINNSDKFSNGLIGENDVNTIRTFMTANGDDLDSLISLYHLKDNVQNVAGVDYVVDDKIEDGRILEMTPLGGINADVAEVIAEETLSEIFGNVDKTDENSYIADIAEKSIITTEQLVKEFGILEDDAKDVVSILNDVYPESVKEYVLNESNDYATDWDSMSVKDRESSLDWLDLDVKYKSVNWEEVPEDIKTKLQQSLGLDESKKIFENKKKTNWGVGFNSRPNTEGLSEGDDKSPEFMEGYSSYKDGDDIASKNPYKDGDDLKKSKWASGWNKAKSENGKNLNESVSASSVLKLLADNGGEGELLDYNDKNKGQYILVNKYPKTSFKKFLADNNLTGKWKTYSQRATSYDPDGSAMFLEPISEGLNESINSKKSILKRLFESRGLKGFERLIKLHESVDAPIQTYADMVVYNKDGRVLLLQRNPDCDFEPNKWGFAGGKVQLGEITKNGAIRECLEESGINVDVDSVTKIGEFANPDGSVSHYYRGNALNDVILGDESQNYIWVDPSDVINYDLILGNKDRFNLAVNGVQPTKLNESVDLEKFAIENEWIGSWRDEYLANKLGVSSVSREDKDAIMLYKLKHAGKKREEFIHPNYSTELLDKVFGKATLNEGKKFIEVSVSSARTAMDTLNDMRQLKFGQDGSNYFTFKKDEDFDDALEAFKKAGVEIYDMSESKLYESVLIESNYKSIIDNIKIISEKFDVFHHNTKSYPQHKSFDQIHESYNSLKDDLIEKIMGYENQRYGESNIGTVSYTDNTGKELVLDLYALGQALISYSKEKSFPDVENVGQEINGLGAKLNYLLTFDEKTGLNEGLDEKLREFAIEYKKWMTEDGVKPIDEFYGQEGSVKEFLENYHEDDMDVLNDLLVEINNQDLSEGKFSEILSSLAKGDLVEIAGLISSPKKYAKASIGRIILEKLNKVGIVGDKATAIVDKVLKFYPVVSTGFGWLSSLIESKNLNESSIEYVLCGIAPNTNEEQLLLTEFDGKKITDETVANNLIKVLNNKGCTNVRVQKINLLDNNIGLNEANNYSDDINKLEEQQKLLRQQEKSEKRDQDLANLKKQITELKLKGEEEEIQKIQVKIDAINREIQLEKNQQKLDALKNRSIELESMKQKLKDSVDALKKSLTDALNTADDMMTDPDINKLLKR